MVNPIAILVVDEDEQRFARTATLLHRCYTPSLLLQRARDQHELLQVTATQKHDVYLFFCGEVQWEHSLLAVQSLVQRCQGAIILIRTVQDIQPGPEAALTARAFAAGVTEKLFLNDLTPSLLKHTVQNAVTRTLMQKQMRESQICLMDSHEHEQALLSRRLHEGPLQDLIGMRFYLGIASDVVESIEAKEQLAFVQQNLQGVIDGLRSLCVDLRPPALGPFGLEKAIRAEVGRFRNRYPELEVVAELDSDELLLSTRIRLVLYRIFQQALQNIVQHADAKLITIYLTLSESTVDLKIQDDGHGFPLPDNWIVFANEGRCGLLEAHERVLNVNGQFQVKSVSAPHPTPGTTISVTIPIE